MSRAQRRLRKMAHICCVPGPPDDPTRRIPKRGYWRRVYEQRAIYGNRRSK